jgi:predicted nucleic acid-binding protein
LSDLVALPLPRVSHRPLLPRCWSLRENVTVYDASYVALAEQLDTTLVTADARLSKAPGLRCPVEVMTPTQGILIHARDAGATWRPTTF